MGKDRSILIVDSLDYASGDVPLRELTVQVDSFKRLFDEEIKRAQALLPSLSEPKIRTFGLPALIPAILGVAVPLAQTVVGLFKRDYIVKEVEFDLKQEALIASVVRWLCEWEFSVYVPHLFPIRADSPLLVGLNELEERVLQLVGVKDLIQEEIDQKRIDVEEGKRAVKEAETLITQFETFIATATKSPDGQIASRMQQAVVRERVESFEITHLLYLKVNSSGGEGIAEKEALHGSKEVSFLGGVALSFILVHKDSGRVAQSDTYIGNREIHHNLHEHQITVGKLTTIA